MPLNHEKLEVYRVSLEYVGWVWRLCAGMDSSYRNAKDQLLRASQSIPLNIAEGNGKATESDRRKFFEIARGSALECGAAQDVLEACGAISNETNQKGKFEIGRIVAMLTRLGGRGFSVQEKMAEYGIDDDNDNDNDDDDDNDNDNDDDDDNDNEEESE